MKGLHNIEGLLSPQCNSNYKNGLHRIMGLLSPQYNSNHKNGLHIMKGILAPQLEKVIIAKGFATLRIFFPRSVTKYV